MDPEKETKEGGAMLKIRISSELKEEMDRAARAREISSSAFVRLAVRAYLEAIVSGKGVA